MVEATYNEIPEDYQKVLAELDELAAKEKFAPAQVALLKTRAAFQFDKPAEGIKELAVFLEALNVESAQVESLRKVSQDPVLLSFNFCICQPGNRMWFIGADNRWRCRSCP